MSLFRTNFTVHCRTGSLEKKGKTIALVDIVHCRTGSLEIEAQRAHFGNQFTAAQAA